ncbi:MAG: nuclear transport factor 2 family protein [Sphingomonadaceae bacterium]|jgi:3-phenylpropionate/cinnamic acid dioxygenase small subunit|nr:nuclear transport factor 2 family protein [Sphingomonadaceae bacterium]
MNQITAIGSGLSAQDERAISGVLVSYGTSIDQRDWKRFRACFSEDCEADYGSFGRWQGAIAITAYMKQAHADLGPTLHRITNIEIRNEDDGVRARTYVDALLMPMNEGGPIHRGVGYYDDQLVRTGSGWKIARRQFVPVLID